MRPTRPPGEQAFAHLARTLLEIRGDLVWIFKSRI